MRIILPEADTSCSCGLETCEVCHGRKVIGSLLHLEPEAPSADAGQQLLAMLQPMQTDWAWQGEMDLSHYGYTMGYSDYIFEPWSDGVSGGSSPSQFAGDETLIGPDGAVYDVFYPLKNGQDEKEETSTTCSDCAGGSPVTMSRQRSAEASIAGVLDFMRSTALARYPARVQLYEKVCSAAKMSLGVHFGRMALIGSTALRIDTPDSDLDVVVYTCTDDSEPLDPVDALQKIAECLKEEEALKLQLVDCARVPVLTVWSEDGRLSLEPEDLTVDQPLGEWHVLWFQSLWQWDPFAALPETLPPPIGEDKDHWSSGLEATALRCIKWWLRRRNIPVSKEGGYPTVVWTLMVLHVMRCSVFVNEEGKKEQGHRALLSAIAAFFDRFAGSGLMGTLCFSMGPDGVSSVFHPCEEGQALMDYTSETPGFSVLDPTTTCDLSVAYGVVPSELAPPLPPATRLLHTYELQRAQRYSALALSPDASAGSGSEALEELFTETSTACNSMPTELPVQTTAVIVLREGELAIGLLTKVSPKRGWTAPFLHRRDAQSGLALQLCEVREGDGLLMPISSKQHWFVASDVVCLAALQPVFLRGQSRGKHLRREKNRWKVDPEGLERWQRMHAILAGEKK